MKKERRRKCEAKELLPVSGLPKNREVSCGKLYDDLSVIGLCTRMALSEAASTSLYELA